MPTVVKFIATETRMVVTKGWESGKWGANRYTALVLKDENVLEIC